MEMGEKIIIERVSNGAIVRGRDCEGNKEEQIFKFEDGEINGLVVLLLAIEEQLSSTCSGRYDEKRISIRIVHGDKYDCKDKKNCVICGEK